MRWVEDAFEDDEDMKIEEQGVAGVVDDTPFDDTVDQIKSLAEEAGKVGVMQATHDHGVRPDGTWMLKNCSTEVADGAWIRLVM